MLDVDVKLDLGKGNLIKKFAYKCIIPEGQWVTVFGKSGEGKTTFLRILAGLQAPIEGTVKWNTQVWFEAKQKIDCLPKDRGVHMVFQQSTLFPNMTVSQNLDFASPDQEDIGHRNKLIDGLALDSLLDLYPHQLSGGQAQRVALGQMLIGKPKCLLLDEPLTSLDQSIRMQIQDFLLQIQKEQKMTVILVSHDLEETIKLSDRVLILENGAFVAQGPPFEVFRNAKAPKASVSGKVVMVEEGASGMVTVSFLVGQQIIEQEHPVSHQNHYKVGSSVTLKLS